MFAQPKPKNSYEQHGYQIYPPLIKERSIIVVATKDSPKKITITWLRPDGSVLFDREFNVVPGEKVIISPVKE